MQNILGRELVVLVPNVPTTIPGIIPLDTVPRVTDTQSSLASLMSDPHQPVAHTDNQSSLGSLMSDPAQTSVGSVKSDDNMGEPARRSTPLQTPDRKVGSVIIKNSEPAKTVKISQFAVSKVVAEEVAVVDSLPPTDLPIPESEVVMNGPLQVNPEAELYDSSSSPGSYYDTASESAPFPTTDNSQSTDYFISVSSDDKLHDLEQVN